MTKKIKINLGCGRKRFQNFVNIDKIQFVDSRGDKMVDLILDVEKDRLPFDDSMVNEIVADAIFEHLGDGFIFCLNECHRVLREGGILKGVVPIAGKEVDFSDPTHKRHFTIHTFDYLCGTGEVKKNRPLRPRYADYGILPWVLENLSIKNGLIKFRMSPRKI